MAIEDVRGVLRREALPPGYLDRDGLPHREQLPYLLEALTSMQL